jgi:rhamnosyltransferase
LRDGSKGNSGGSKGGNVLNALNQRLAAPTEGAEDFEVMKLTRGCGDNLVAAIVVLHRPDHNAVRGLIQSLEDQVELIFVIDNTPTLEVVPEMDLFPSKCKVPLHYAALGENAGIATAQNHGIREALSAGASHVILFDQDSLPAAGMVQALLAAEGKLVKEGSPVAAVGPVFIDERSGWVSPAVRYSLFGLRTIPISLSNSAAVEAHFLIASGCLIRASVLSAVGLMREDLFIDWVDNEWGLRVRSMGLRCYVIPDAQMRHRVGDGVICLFGRQIHLHTETRNYYLLRNAIYLMRVRTMGFRWKLSFLPRLPLYLVVYPLLAEKKLRHFATLLRAVLDGMSGRLGRIDRS